MIVQLGVGVCGVCGGHYRRTITSQYSSRFVCSAACKHCRVECVICGSRATGCGPGAYVEGV